MRKDVFEGLRIGDIIHHTKQRVNFRVDAYYPEGRKVQISRNERIEANNLEEWHYEDEESTPVSKTGIQELKLGDHVVHAPSDISYLVACIDGNYAYCVCIRVVCEKNAGIWHLHAKSQGIRPA